jgi:hypothetical protein
LVQQTEDVVTLLGTRDGSYAAACALDFSSSSRIYYDTFALRDSEGQKAYTQSWPYFLSHDSLSALRDHRPVPVRSCWNGMIAFDAKPFYPVSLGGNGLKFRGVDDELAKYHVEGSECCLIHADNRALGGEQGVWLNPNVRVSYNLTTYTIINPTPGENQWPAKWDMLSGMWENRFARWVGWIKLRMESKLVAKRVKKWIKEGKKSGKKPREEPGIECLVNEMQILFKDGWHHV